MACKRVFNTPELLEAILAKLPCRELLLSQRVDRSWHTTIQGSVKLKRTLFMAPAGPVLSAFGRKRIVFRSGGENSQENHQECQVTDEAFRYATTQTAKLAYPVVANALMAEVFPVLDRRQANSIRVKRFTSRKAVAWNREEASWRKMFVCQPPVSSIHECQHIRNLEEPRFLACNVKPIGLSMRQVLPCVDDDIWHNDDGLTMGNIADYYETFHTEVGHGRRPRVFLHDIFTWWRPRSDCVTGETLAVDLEPYAWQEEPSKLSSLPRNFRDDDSRGDNDWQQWSS